MSAKNAASIEPAAQSAAEREAADAEIHALTAKFAPAHAGLFDAARQWLRKRLPTAHEVVYEYRDCFVISYSPNEHGYDGVFALRASADAVQLYFNQGKGLPDPAKLLQGSAKQVRSIVLATDTLARLDVTALLDAALARNPVPYAPTGHGAVIVRSTSAKKRRATPSKEPT
jgi:hypothetical protein